MASISFFSVRSLIKAAQDLSRAHLKLEQGEEMSIEILEMEMGLLGLALTSDEKYLEDYQKSRTRFLHLLSQALDDPGVPDLQLVHLNELKRLTDLWFVNHVEPLLTRYQESTPIETEEARAFLMRGLENEELRQTRRTINTYIATIRELLAERTDLERHHANFSNMVMIFGVIFIILIGCIAGYAIIRNVVGQVGGEPAEVVAISRRISKGDLACGGAAGSVSKDSIMGTIHTMRDNLSGMISDISYGMETLSKTSEQLP